LIINENDYWYKVWVGRLVINPALQSGAANRAHQNAYKGVQNATMSVLLTNGFYKNDGLG
jgi:hypothetical protein